MELSYKQQYPVKGDSIRVEVEGHGVQRIKVRSPKKAESDGSGRDLTYLGTFDQDGLTYWVSIQRDRWGYPEREKPWRIFGEPEVSRRAKAAKTRKTMTETQKAELDAAVLYSLKQWGPDGAEAALVADDVLRNRGFDGTDGWVARYTNWGDRKRENRMIASSLARLQREGRAARQDWRIKLGGNRYVNPWVLAENKGKAPKWRRESEITGHWPFGED